MSNSIILGVGLGDNVSRDMDKLANKLRGKMRALSSVGQSMSMTLTLPIVAAGAALLKFTGDLDAMKKALAANMGGMKQANVEFEKLRELAKAPGIGFEEAVQGSYRLQGLGKSADQARTIMEGLAKAVALSGGGNAEFGGVMTQVAQMFGKGRVLQQDLKFMIENAPILSKVMKDVFGTIDTEEIQKKGISATQFIDGLIGGLKNMQGIGGSVKNSMENLWTSIKIGAGEIGLSIVGVTSWDKAIDGAADSVQRITSDINKWVQQHGILTKAILTTIAAMAVVGPLTSFIANIGILGTLAVSAAAKIGTLLKTTQEYYAFMTSTSAGAAMTGGFIAITAAVLEQHIALENLGKMWDKLVSDADNNGNLTILDRFYSSLMGLGALAHALPNFGQAGKFFKTAISGNVNDTSAPQGAFGPANGGRTGFEGMKGRGFSVPQIVKHELTTEEKNAIEKKIEAANKYAREMQEMWAHNPVSNLPSSPDRGILGAMKAIQPSGGVGSYIKQSDVNIMDEYNAALRDIAINQNLGSKEIDVAKEKMDAAATAYKGMAEAYGMNSPEAMNMLDQWQCASDAYTSMADAQVKAQEKVNNALKLGKEIMSGVADVVGSMFEGGGKGAENTVKAIEKVIAAVIKLLVAEFIEDSIKKLGFVGAIPAIIGGGIVIGAVDGLMNKISMAGGGVISGETMIRAGEYPGAAMGNPEVIAPANKMMGYIRQAVGESGGGGQLTATVHGDQLLFLVSRAQNRANRRGSGNAIRM